MENLIIFLVDIDYLFFIRAVDLFTSFLQFPLKKIKIKKNRANSFFLSHVDF